MSMLQDRQTARSLCRCMRHGSGGKAVSLSMCLQETSCCTDMTKEMTQEMSGWLLYELAWMRV